MVAYGRKPKARFCGGVPGESSAPRLKTCPSRVTLRTATTTGDGTFWSHVGWETVMEKVEARTQKSRKSAIWFAQCTEREGSTRSKSQKEEKDRQELPKTIGKGSSAQRLIECGHRAPLIAHISSTPRMCETPTSIICIYLISGSTSFSTAFNWSISRRTLNLKYPVRHWG